MTPTVAPWNTCGKHVRISRAGRTRRLWPNANVRSRAIPIVATHGACASRVFHALDRYDDALNDLAYIIAREPDNVDALLQRASYLLERVLTGNTEFVAYAKNAVSEVLELAPAEPVARAFRGVIAGMEGDAKGAIDELSFAIAHGARWNDAFIYRAAALMQTNAYNDALRDLGRAAGLYGSIPTPSTILWKRARCYMELGELDRAISDYTTLISRHPNHHRGYQYRADVYVKQCELSLALADHDQAVKLRPAEADTYFRRSLVRWRKGDTTGALADIDRMEQLLPRSCAPPFCAGVMTLLSRQKLDSALSSFDRAIALEPNFALPYLLRVRSRQENSLASGNCRRFARNSPARTAQNPVWLRNQANRRRRRPTESLHRLGIQMRRKRPTGRTGSHEAGTRSNPVCDEQPDSGSVRARELDTLVTISRHSKVYHRPSHAKNPLEQWVSASIRLLGSTRAGAFVSPEPGGHG